MPARELNNPIARLKAELRRQPFGTSHREALEQTIADLEVQLATHKAFDSKLALGRLRDWEARLAVEHPLLSELLSDVAHKLEAMGI